MLNCDSLPTQTRQDVMKYLERPVASKEEFLDKVRIVIIIILTSNEKSLHKDSLAAIKKSKGENQGEEGQS